MSVAANPATVSTNQSGLALPVGLDVVTLGAVGLAGALLAARVQAAPLALVLILGAAVLRIVQYRAALLSIPLHLPLLLFIVSAVIGVYVSYDFALSLRKFYLIIAGIALYYVLATTHTEVARELVVWGLLLVCVGTAVYFMTQTDFAQEPAKVSFLNQIGLTIHRLSPQFGWHTPHPNLMAGIMMLGLPYSVLLGIHALRKREWLRLIPAALVTLILAAGILLTTSRGAWLALAIVTGGGLLLYLAAQLARRAGLAASIGMAIAVNLILILFVLLIPIGGTRILNTFIGLTGSARGVPRTELYAQVIRLGQDFAFTGAGLDSFQNIYSTYELLIDVPFLPHAHDLWLQIWFEQGVLGLVAFVWFVIAYYVWIVQRRARMNWLAFASVLATTLMLLHGFVDVLFYFSRVLPLMFIPIGLTIGALEPFLPLPVGKTDATRRTWLLGAAAAGIVLVCAVLFFITRRDMLIAQAYANLGALRQAQLEVAQINFPDPTPEQVRLSTDESSAEEYYRAALRRDPTNRTANMRLGLIALDQFDFQEAVNRLQVAHTTDPNDHAVMKALGYAYVGTGQLDKAEPLLRQIPEAIIELNTRLAAWRKLGKPELIGFGQAMIRRLKGS